MHRIALHLSLFILLFTLCVFLRIGATHSEQQASTSDSVDSPLQDIALVYEASLGHENVDPNQAVDYHPHDNDNVQTHEGQTKGPFLGSTEEPVPSEQHHQDTLSHPSSDSDTTRVPSKIRNAIDIMREAHQQPALKELPHQPPTSVFPSHEPALNSSFTRVTRDLNESSPQAQSALKQNMANDSAPDKSPLDEAGHPVFLLSFLATDAALEISRKSGLVSAAGVLNSHHDIVDPFDEANAEFHFSNVPPSREEGHKRSWRKSVPSDSSFAKQEPSMDNAKPSSSGNATSDTAFASDPNAPLSERAYNALREVGSYIRAFGSLVSSMFSDQVSLLLIVKNVLAFAAAISVLVVYIGFMYSAISLPVFVFAVFEDSTKNLAPVVVKLFLSAYIVMTLVYITGGGQIIHYYAGMTAGSPKPSSFLKTAMLALTSILLRLFSSPIVVVPFILPFSLGLDLIVRMLGIVSSGHGLSLRNILSSYKKTSGLWGFRVAYVISILSFVLLSVLTSMSYINKNEIYDMREEP